MKCFTVTGILALVWAGVVTAKVSYMFTAPATLSVGKPGQMVITLYNVVSTGQVVVELIDSQNKTHTRVVKPYCRVSRTPSQGDPVTISFKVAPGYKESTGTLRIKGTFGKESILNSTTIGVQTLSQQIFIQTDKPIYKAGQEIKFRILVTDSMLKPVASKTTCDVWIENEGGIRLMQWLGQKFDNPIIQLSFQLSNQPTLGTWNIFVNTSDGVMNQQSVIIQDYVLPKFETTITLPLYALVSDDSFTVKICGEYTYGEPVVGTVLAVASYYTYYYFGQETTVFPVTSKIAPINDCYNFVVKESELNWKNSSYSYNTIQINATITEAGTGITRNASTMFSLSTNPVVINFQPSTQQYYKSGFPYYGSVLVTNPDNSPRPNEPIEVCVSASNFPTKDEGCKNFTSDSSGTFKFSFLTYGNGTQEIEVTATAVNYPDYYSPYGTLRTYILYYQPSGYLSITPWYSPSGTFMQIEDRPAVCNQKLTLSVLVTGTDVMNHTVYYEVVSRGGIVATPKGKYISTISANRTIRDDFIKNASMTAAGVRSYPTKTIEMQILITPKMTPRIHVLVYYVRQDQEVIADSRDFDITSCFENNVQFSFAEEKQFPGTNATATITASADSYCGVVAVDKSVYLLANGGRLTPDTLSEALQNYDNQNYFPEESYCDECDFESGGGPIIMERRKRSILPRPYFPSSSGVDSSRAFRDGRVIVMTDLLLNTRPCIRRPCIFYAFRRFEKVALEDNAGGALPAPSLPAGGAGSPPSQVRSDFRETFLWELVKLSGITADITRKLPDTITQWSGNAICINSKDGLGISASANITTFKSIFVSISLPYSVIRGETVAITISVFNYESKPVPVTLELSKSDMFLLKNASASSTFCIQPGVSSSVVYLITPSVLGVVNLTATATTTTDTSSCGSTEVSNVTTQDQIITPLLVEAEGFPLQENKNLFLCTDDITKSFEATLALEAPNEIVADSLVAQIAVTGDILGPALRNIDALITIPSGCGEQNMIGFAPDVYIASYLKATGGFSADLQTKLYDYMQQGYQRELTYRRTDGSYSAFGQSDASGSIWLSAFVIQVYVAAAEFIFIDDKDVATTGFWIVNQQQKDGCFPQVGTVIHTDLIGGVGDSTTSTVPLSAYIIASLIQAGQISDDKLTLGLSCLKADPNPAIYTLALTTYALALAKDADASTYYDNFLSKSITDGGLTYWEATSPSIQVEIASYAVLSVLELNGDSGVADALPIIRWLITQSNGNGGFISSQDTVIGIKALSKYAGLIGKEPPQLAVTFTNADQSITKSFTVNSGNKLLQQTVDLDKDPKSLTVSGDGTGCIFAQYTLNYNVPKPANQKSFTITVQATRSSRDCRIVTVSACFVYTGPNKASGMVIVTFKLVSGYSVDIDTLDNLSTDDKLALKRYEVKQSTVTFYFDEATKDNKCFTFDLHQDNVVSDTKNGLAQILDYYQTENFATADLVIAENCP